MTKTLISIVGPTAIGKTKLAIAIAQKYQTVILSADSRQFFKEMSIGTAVPSKTELAAVTHYFIQHKSIFETYSVGDFETEAMLLIEKLFKKYDVLVLVGGSGLYVKALIDGLDYFPEIAPEIRVHLNKSLEKNGIETLQKELELKDPNYYKRVDTQNPHRLIRALEICRGTGQPYSSFLQKNKAKRFFKVISLGIEADRKIIYDRINQRVDLMVQEGLIDEARELLPYKHLNALQTVGYKELFAHFEGECTLEFAISEIKKNTRRFAKRQLTWFRKKEDIIWLNYLTSLPQIIQSIEKQLHQN